MAEDAAAGAGGPPLVAVSPHLDDAVLGCAGLIAAHPGALVVTVTAGRPGPHPLTDWDRQCGFAEGDDVVGFRRQEDEAALAVLSATPRWLDFLDRQYADGVPPDVEEVAAALAPLVRAAPLVASPLGLGHPDHLAVAQACMALARETASASATRWVVYEDAIYRSTTGGSSAALARLCEEGFAVTEIDVAPAAEKRRATGAYTSQVRGLARLLDDAAQPERYWELTVK